MAEKEGYDVLRLIEHGKVCYISSEYVEGRPLTLWLKYHSHITKEELFTWISEITRQLGCIHKCRGNPCYRYVNPYSLIRSKDGQLYFLDMSAKSNAEREHFMQKRCIREHFRPPWDPYYQRESVELDIYGLGKTIQYLLSVTEPEPVLKRKEEFRFRKIITKCLGETSKKPYQNISEIRKQIPIYKPKEVKEKNIKGKAVLAVCAAVVCLFAARQVLISSAQKSARDHPTVDSSLEMKDTSAEDSTAKTNLQEKMGQEAFMDLALAYFLELQDYENSIKYLKEIADSYPPAKELKAILQIMMQGTEAVKAEELYSHLLALEEEMPKEKQEAYYQCLLKGYHALNTEESSENLIRIGNNFLEDRTLPSDVEQETKEYMGAAYEQLEQWEEAAECYTEALELESEQQPREELYKKIALLYESGERMDMALETCVQANKELKESVELKLLHIRLMCKDDSVTKEACAQTIGDYLKQEKEIQEEEEFKKLQKEYEIRVEGEKVWVGR